MAFTIRAIPFTTQSASMCYTYTEYKYCAQGPRCRGGYGWVNSQGQSYAKSYAQFVRIRRCSNFERGYDCRQRRSLGPDSETKTSEETCLICQLW
ncbi:hypothetical protein QR685DRAFT_467845 [Neurospora intermedia]|uniref:Uncharacterized protein n=1 Tax=Neurospora intermedia TaxID=5142 RepID=A0ABR3DJ47_NEUIN